MPSALIYCTHMIKTAFQTPRPPPPDLVAATDRIAPFNHTRETEVTSSEEPGP